MKTQDNLNWKSFNVQLAKLGYHLPKYAHAAHPISTLLIERYIAKDTYGYYCPDYGHLASWSCDRKEGIIFTDSKQSFIEDRSE
jgi:hypothetical protein